MARTRLLVCAAALVTVAAGPAPAQPTAAEAWSPRNASYVIDVALDPAAKTLVGRETLRWRNIQDEATSELWFHLYWNAWRNSRSTWMLEDRLRGRSDRAADIAEGDWGYLEIDAIRLAAQEGQAAIDLSDAMRFVSPDDGNQDDRTVMMVPLPRPVAPGETIEVELEFRARVPRTFARTGYRGDYYFIAHWYPSVGVYEADGWHCQQFHAGTEFYSDYGVYDVSVQVPDTWVLGASGRLVERRETGDGDVVHRHVGEDIHNFTWTTSPDYEVHEKRFEHPGLPPVDMRLLLQGEHRGQEQRHFAATEAALQHYGTWYGPYPYGYITVVDPAYGSGAGGMEYPTLFTCGTRLLNPPGGGSPEGVTVHEAGHQFWYGIVGNDEFRHAWMDEGLNTFSTARTMDEAFGERQLVRRYLGFPERSGPGAARRSRRSGFLPVLFPDIKSTRMVGGNRLDGYRGAATSDAQATPSYRYFPGTGGRITYDKTALWLSTLERHLGWETLRSILSTFFDRFSFAHPTPEDFFAIADEISGQDLSWFFDQVYRSSLSFDYAVQSVSSRPAGIDGFVAGDAGLEYVSEKAAEDDDRTIYRSEVVVRRNGGARFPVDVLLVFEDGSEQRHAWDGQERWKLFVEERASRLKYAAVDPDRVLLLDLYYTNNTRLREPKAGFPARKWASKWMIWLQDLMLAFTFFV